LTINEYTSSDLPHQKHVVLFGHPLSHSLSPIMHKLSAEYHGLDFNYGLVDVPPHRLSEVPALFNNNNLIGANITIPYKEQFLDIADTVKPVAKQIGAVNTLFRKNNRLIGDNTDAFGFVQPLLQENYDFEGQRVLIFGTGGATKAIIYALINQGVSEFVLVSRNPGRNANINSIGNTQVIDYQMWAAYAEEAALIINATPLGMAPKTANSPVSDNEIGFLAGKICYDIVYNPIHTLFLKQARRAGAETISGLDMLIHQGSRAFQRWTGNTFPVPLIRQKLNEALK